MEGLDERIIQTKPKLQLLAQERLKDQKAYYDAGRHDFYSLLDNQLAIMEALKRLPITDAPPADQQENQNGN